MSIDRPMAAMLADEVEGLSAIFEYVESHSCVDGGNVVRIFFPQGCDCSAAPTGGAPVPPCPRGAGRCDAATVLFRLQRDYPDGNHPSATVILGSAGAALEPLSMPPAAAAALEDGHHVLLDPLPWDSLFTPGEGCLYAATEYLR
eukprot:GHVU01013981.1.p1 GENE.GHVU01013981.1~~GHVU01013981.1.p1  ORF type:complete len:145 (-),score=17.21 GHVU01013981.1:83-517(-)